MPLRVAFAGFIEMSKRVSPTCPINFERSRYSAPAFFANRPVSLRIYPDQLVVAAEGNILCEHVRVIQRSICRRRRSMAGDTILPSFNESQARFGRGRRSWNCQMSSVSCSIKCPAYHRQGQLRHRSQCALGRRGQHAVCHSRGRA